MNIRRSGTSAPKPGEQLHICDAIAQADSTPGTHTPHTHADVAHAHTQGSGAPSQATPTPPAPLGPTPGEASPYIYRNPTTHQPKLEFKKIRGAPFREPKKKSAKKGGRGRGSKGGRTTNAHERRKDFLEPDEMKALLRSSSRNRHAARDHLLILMMFQHGLRVTEACKMKISDVNLKTARVWVGRLKGSLDTQQPLSADALRAMRRYLRQRDDDLPWLFLSERGGPLTRRAVGFIVKGTGRRVGLDVWPHMLRHSCGFYLANRGTDFRTMQDYLGHRDPKHTTRYTRIAGKRFTGLWD